MIDRPFLLSGPMVRALLDGRKTQARRVLPYGVEGSPVEFRRGDRLWVREAYAFGPLDPPPVIYRATAEADGWEVGRKAKWRPSIHMPRTASRLTLNVTDVRVQRLQQISEADAWAEGCKRGEPWDSGKGHFPAEEPHSSGKCWVGWDEAREWFADIWDSLNVPRGYGWDANPWVVALTFTVHRQNIDQVSA